eukprot:7384359-Prymnesium_polylepis.1
MLTGSEEAVRVGDVPVVYEAEAAHHAVVCRRCRLPVSFGAAIPLFALHGFLPEVTVRAAAGRGQRAGGAGDREEHVRERVERMAGEGLAARKKSGEIPSCIHRELVKSKFE